MALTVMIYESIIPTCKGVVVFEEARRASNWRNQMTLDEFLKAKKFQVFQGLIRVHLPRLSVSMVRCVQP